MYQGITAIQRRCSAAVDARPCGCLHALVTPLITECAQIIFPRESGGQKRTVRRLCLSALNVEGSKPLGPQRTLPTEDELRHSRPAAADLTLGRGSADGEETAGELPDLQGQQPQDLPTMSSAAGSSNPPTGSSCDGAGARTPLCERYNRDKPCTTSQRAREATLCRSGRRTDWAGGRGRPTKSHALMASMRATRSSNVEDYVG